MKYYLILITISSIMFSCVNESGNKKDKLLIDKPEYIPNIEYGYNLDSFQVFRDTVLENQTLSHLLLPFAISQYEINLSADLASDSAIGLKYVTKGREYLVLCDLNDTNKRALYFIYPKNKVDFIVFDFTKDPILVERRSKENSINEKIISGEIVKNSNLTFAINQQMKDINITGEMAEGIAGIFAWTIDFFKLHPGDEFKVIYEEKSVEGEPYAIGKINFAHFKHQNKDFYAFYYLLDSTEKKGGYFDENGKEMKRPFLMAPVQFSRISSGFSGKRFHPVQKRWKAHLGTDYAAPKGTPIWSTADGYVIEASYTSGNGNYVKVKHNDTYTTQYLHMSGFAKGIKKGTFVKQGEIIGYVGSTGLATGPHVCYRFWKNGQQIDHRAEKFPESLPMVDSLLPHYLNYIKSIKEKLDSIPITPYQFQE